MLKILSAGAFLCVAMCAARPACAATHQPDQLQSMAAAIARIGRIDDPAQVAAIMQDTIGVGLVRVNDFFGRSDMDAGQTRYALDDREKLAQEGLEVALLIRHENNDQPTPKTSLPPGPGQSAAFGVVKAELDINDWGVISPHSWRSVAGSLGKFYSSVVLPDTPGIPSFELPSSACCRLIMTVAPRRIETQPVWFVHITEYDIRPKS